jgi:hypothetical protein
LRIFNSSVSCSFHEAYSSKGHSGFAFRHDTPELLLMLRQQMEYMRQGSSCVQSPRKILKPPYDDASWMCFRGDGPCDLNLSSENNEAMIVFAFNGKYGQLRIHEQKIFTGQSEATKSGSTAAKLLENRDVDQTVVEKSMLLLLGLLNTFDTKKQIQGYLDLLNNFYCKTYR